MSQAIATTPRPALAPSAVTTPFSGWLGSEGSVSTRQSSLGSGESGFATTTGSRPAEPTVRDDPRDQRAAGELDHRLRLAHAAARPSR